MEERLAKLEKEVALIQERNKRVEADKGWETSATRIFFIVVLTYVFATVALYFIGASHIFRNALIPTLGFFLSTLSLPVVRRWWVGR